MKIVAFVPLKLNNERLPGKNTKKFANGVPLLSYILNTLLLVDKVDDIYVYCSDDSIKEFLPKRIKFLVRDEYLDLATTSFNDVLTTFAEKVDADIYVLAHATAPFITKETICKAINAVENDGYDSACSVVKIQDFLWKDGKPYNYDPNSIPRTQDLVPFYAETCGLYVYTSDLIKKHKKRIGKRPYLAEVSKIEACDINNSDDFAIAEAIAMHIL